MTQFIIKTISDFIKNTKVVNLFQKERFITKISEEISLYIKGACKIPTEENILMVLDDSHIKNLNQIVVFTNKKIYWTVKNTSLKIKQNNTEINTKGPGSINNQLLKNVSIFSKREKDVKFIFILSDNIQLIIPFIHFQIENSLTLSFYDYVSNYCGGYKPDTTKNEVIYRKISKTKEIVKINIIAKLFNALSYIVALSLIANIVLQYYQYFIIENGKIICIIMILKLMSIISGYKKSMYSNLLLLILTYNIILLPEIDYYLSNMIIYPIYAGIIILFGTFDFDKIFRYSAFILSIVSIGYMILKYFNVGMLLRYLP